MNIGPRYYVVHEPYTMPPAHYDGGVNDAVYFEYAIRRISDGELVFRAQTKADANEWWARLEQRMVAA